METTFNEIVQTYYKEFEGKSDHSQIGREYSLKLFFEYFHVESVKDIEKIKLIEWNIFKGHLKKGGLKASSTNTHLRRILAFVNWLWLNEITTYNTHKKVKLERVQEDLDILVLSKEDQIAMINAAKNLRDKTIIVLMFELLLRRSEVANIKVSDIKEEEHGTYLYLVGKGDKPAKLKIREDVYSLIKKHLETKKDSSEFLFCSKMRKTGMEGQSINNIVKKLGKDAGFNEDKQAKLHAHLTRHAGITNVVKKFGIAAAQKAARHSSITTTMRYSHLDQDVVDNVFDNQDSAFKFIEKGE